MREKERQHTGGNRFLVNTAQSRCAKEESNALAVTGSEENTAQSRNAKEGCNKLAVTGSW